MTTQKIYDRESGTLLADTAGAQGPQGEQGDKGDPGSLVFKGAWSGATAYVVDDVVSLAGASYVCILGHTNHTPPNVTYWGVLSAAGADAALTSVQSPAGTAKTGVRTVIDTVVGPVSYAAGGFEVDLSARFSTLLVVGVEVDVPGAILMPVVMQVRLNVSGAGKFTLKLFTAANVELPALTVLSGATFRYMAVGMP